MRLPIPIYTRSGEIYTQVCIIRPKSKVLADTKKIIDSGNIFSGMKTFISGCTEELVSTTESVSDSRKLSEIILDIPYRSAYYIAIQIVLLYDSEDGVEGLYTCPRCGKKHLAEKTPELDNRDFIRNMEVVYRPEGLPNLFEAIISTPVILYTNEDGKKEILLEVTSMEFHYPTLRDCIAAYARVGLTDELRFQFAVYIEALEKVNGQQIDSKFKYRYGDFIFENIEDIKKDLSPIKEEIEKFGLITKAAKVCMVCGKKWSANINPSNFFVSALQPM